MRITLKDLINKFIWLLTVFLFVTFLIFDTYAWGRYAFFGVSVLIVLLSAIMHGGIVRIRLQPYHGFFLLFTVYVAASALWAWSPSDAISKAITLAQILLCSAMLYIHYDREENAVGLLRAVMWAGFIVSVYAIFFYGIDGLTLTEEDRLENEFANINIIGMTAALACVIQVHEWLCKRRSWSVLLMIPAVIMIAATQSRKALVFLVFGVFGVYIVRNLQQKGFSKKLWRILFSVLFVCVAFYLILRLPVFEGLMARMESMFASWSGEGEADSSATIRNNMVALGWEYFLKYPVGGIGIGSSGVLTQRYLGWSAYLHNNYVELLSGGGIIGFILYYAMHVYILFNLIKYRKADPEAFTIGLVWLGITLGMHYGMVAYYTKLDWYYLLTQFLLVEGMKKKGRQRLNEFEKAH